MAETTPNGPTNLGTPNGNTEKTSKPNGTVKKPSKFKQIWDKAGLDAQTLLLMLKGSLPPIIAIAMYQPDDVAGVYSTLGYLIAITSVLGMCIMPRGMFIQTMLLNLLAVCVAASMCLLALYTGIQARLHTTAPGAAPDAYNSSACAVFAVWLIFQTYLTNALRAARPQFQFPVILYSIFMSVSLTYGVQFPTMTYAISFMQRLLEAFFTGFAIATGVSLFFFPISSRKVAFKEMAGYLGLLGGMLNAQSGYLQSLEDFDPEVAHQLRLKEAEEKKSKLKRDVKSRMLLATPQAAAPKALLEKLYGLHTRIPTDINFAKREVAIGKMSGRDMTGVWKRMSLIMIPISGLNTVIDILQRRAEATGWRNTHPTEQEEKARSRHIENLHQLMHCLHEPFASMSADVNAALQHVSLTLELTKPPKKRQDEENKGDSPAPGTPGFAQAYKKQLDGFFDAKKRSLREWFTEHDIELPTDFFETTFVRPEKWLIESEHERERHQRQLFFALYVEYLLWRAGRATLDLVLYVDERKQAGALSKTRLIVPEVKTLRKWGGAIFGREDVHDEDSLTADLDQGANSSINIGQSFSKRKDPEHLPPANTLEKIGEVIRLIPQALRSDASAFGFRVVCATMSIAIICYLRDSQLWFLRNRLLWAMIMVPLSMTRTAGQSAWSFLLRILGTAIAMIGAYMIWYIVDGKTAGVIVFLWVWIFCAFYVVLKKPKLIIVAILSIVTAILIIGYELQTRVVGKAVSESNGQPAYATYLLAPYRLATVCGGLLVAYIWTIFPYPVSESTELRKDIGAALYLMANMYSVVHETVKACVQKIDGDHNVKGTRAYHLEKARNQVFSKLVTLITTLKQNSAFAKFQLRVGGRFPLEEYKELIDALQRVLQYTALISYASRTFSTTDADSKWSSDFRKLLGNVNATSHKLTSLLSLLSASMMHARPLPPYLEIPQHAKYMKTLSSIDPDILSVRHIAEPEYSAFAVTTICAQCINDDVVRITKLVKALVGEIDFSFHAVSTGTDSSG